VAKHVVGCAMWSLAIPDTVECLKKAAEIGFEPYISSSAGIRH